MRKGKSPSKARVVKATRWTADEWRLIVIKARQLRMTPSAFIRAKALGTPPWLIRWPGERKRAA